MSMMEATYAPINLAVRMSDQRRAMLEDLMEQGLLRQEDTKAVITVAGINELLERLIEVQAKIS